MKKRLIKILILVPIFLLSFFFLLTLKIFAQTDDFVPFLNIRLNYENQPVKIAIVQIDSQKKLTDNNGVAQFEYIKRDRHTITVTYNGKVYQNDFDIKESIINLNISNNKLFLLTPNNQNSTTNNGFSLGLFGIYMLIALSIFLALLGTAHFIDNIKEFYFRFSWQEISVAGFIVLIFAIIFQVFYFNNSNIIIFNTNNQAAVNQKLIDIVPINNNNKASATLTQIDKDNLQIVLITDNLDSKQNIYIQSYGEGCTKPGPLYQKLNDIQNGKSSTILNNNLDYFISNNFLIVIYNNINMDKILSCGYIGNSK